MIGTIDVNVQAKFPAMPLDPMQAYVGSPSSIRVRNVPKKIGDWNITRVQFVAAYPDSTIKTAECVLVGGVWVGTIEGTQTSGKCLNGYSIYACGIDENGSAVSGYCLGKGDIEILKADGTIDPDAQAWYMKLYDEKPDDPNKGDVYIGSGMFEVWNGEEWFQQEVPLPSDLARTGLQTSVSEFINDVGYITANALPTNVSELENDAGYITASAIPSDISAFNNNVGYITASAIPSNVSELNNDVGFITSSAIPSNISAFNNDVGYLTASTFTAKKVYNDSEDQYVNGDCQVFKQEMVTSPWSFSDGGTREVNVFYQDEPYPDTPWVICGSDCATLPYQDCFYSTKEEAETTLSFTYPIYSGGEYINVNATRTRTLEWVMKGTLATSAYVDSQIGLVLSEAF